MRQMCPEWFSKAHEFEYLVLTGGAVGKAVGPSGEGALLENVGTGGGP